MAKEPRRRKSLTKEEMFWDQKAYKQCLWNYFLKKGKPLVQKDYDLIWKQFNEIEADCLERYREEEEEKKSNGDHLRDNDVRDVAMKITNSRTMKELKVTKALIMEGGFDGKQRKYLKELYIQRRTRLKA